MQHTTPTTWLERSTLLRPLLEQYRKRPDFWSKAGAATVMYLIFFYSFSIGGGWGWWFHHDLIHDDGDYISHAFTIALDHDFDYRNEVSNTYYVSRNGLPSNPVGPGILAAPFVAAFATIDRIQGHPVIQDHVKFFGSWAFFGFCFASSFYFLHAIHLYYRSARMIAPLGRLYTYLLCTGTGMLAYVLHRPTMSHAYEFWTMALIVYASLRFTRDRGAMRLLWALVAGLAAALAWLCRYYALYAFVLPHMILLFQALFQGKPQWRKLLADSAILLAGEILALIPALLVNIAIYGQPYQSMAAYGNTTTYIPPFTNIASFIQAVLALIIPRLWGIPVILFGNSYGILYFTPIIPVGVMLLVVALYRNRLADRAWRLLAGGLVACYLAGPFTLVLLWRMAGSAYGFRYLYGIIPLGFLGLCYWLAQETYPPVWRKRVLTGLLVLSLFGTFGPMALSAMKQVGYSKEAINEFGAKEELSPRQFLYRALACIPNIHFWRRLHSFSPATIIRLSLRREPMQTFGPGYHDNMPAQTLTLLATWGAFIVWFVFRRQDQPRQ